MCLKQETGGHFWHTYAHAHTHAHTYAHTRGISNSLSLLHIYVFIVVVGRCRPQISISSPQNEILVSTISVFAKSKSGSGLWTLLQDWLAWFFSSLLYGMDKGKVQGSCLGFCPRPSSMSHSCVSWRLGVCAPLFLVWITLRSSLTTSPLANQNCTF